MLDGRYCKITMFGGGVSVLKVYIRTREMTFNNNPILYKPCPYNFLRHHKKKFAGYKVFIFSFLVNSSFLLATYSH